MTNAISQTYSAAYAHRIRLTYAFFAASMFLLVMYAFNVYSVISRTVALQKIDNGIAALSPSVDALDAQYLKLSSSVTPDSLKTYGLSEGEVTAYISRNASLGSVAIGGREL